MFGCVRSHGGATALHVTSAVGSRQGWGEKQKSLSCHVQTTPARREAEIGKCHSSAGWRPGVRAKTFLCKDRCVRHCNLPVRTHSYTCEHVLAVCNLRMILCRMQGWPKCFKASVLLPLWSTSKSVFKCIVLFVFSSVKPLNWLFLQEGTAKTNCGPLSTSCN